jgi:hypothetical protein
LTLKCLDERDKNTQ